MTKATAPARPQGKRALKPGQGKLAEIRRAKGLSQLELAELVGTAPARISDWENGRKRPKMENVEALARGLSVEISDLVPLFYDPTHPDYLLA